MMSGTDSSYQLEMAKANLAWEYICSPRYQGQPTIAQSLLAKELEQKDVKIQQALNSL